MTEKTMSITINERDVDSLIEALRYSNMYLNERIDACTKMIGHHRDPFNEQYAPQTAEALTMVKNSLEHTQEVTCGILEQLKEENNG